MEKTTQYIESFLELTRMSSLFFVLHIFPSKQANSLSQY